MKHQFKELLKAIQPRKAVKYTVVHDGQKPTKAIKGVHYKIVCESPQKACPLTVEEVLALKDYQVDELLKFIELRRRKKILMKADLNYKNWFNQLKNK